MFFYLLGDKMAFCYLVFLFSEVSVNVNDLHSVAKCGMNGLNIICCCDKHHLREVEIKFDEVIVKGVVLFRVKDFEQCRLWVAIDIVSAHLVNLIEDKDGI